MNQRFCVGFDVGGTNTRAVLLRGFNRPRGPALIAPTPKSRRGLLELAGSFVSRLEREDRRVIAGLGVGVAGVVDRARGRVIHAPHLPLLNGWNIAGSFRDRFGVPVRIENDVRCFLRAEATWGAARGKRNVVTVAIGTGIGGGIMVNGNILYGARGGAGEVGHMIMQVKSQRSKIKSYGWEDLGALRAFRKGGDRSEVIGIGIANLINIFDPELVVLGGGAVFSGGVRLPVVRRMVRRFAVSPLARATPIVPGVLGESAQAIGAALLVAAER